MLPILSNDVIACVNQSAQNMRIPSTLILSVMKTEGGRNGLASPNKNGTYDYGLMQVNSRWLDTLASHGITEYDLRYNDCINIQVGTWILATAITQGTSIWQGVGNYHSHTATLNHAYSVKVKENYTKIVRIVSH